jgi:hypothetical protein
MTAPLGMSPVAYATWVAELDSQLAELDSQLAEMHADRVDRPRLLRIFGRRRKPLEVTLPAWALQRRSEPDPDGYPWLETGRAPR